MPRQLQDGFGCVRPLTVITPIARGGTASDNAPQAVINLGGISRSKIDQPLGVAGADQDGFLKMKYLDAVGVFNGITLEGEKELVRSTDDRTYQAFFFVSNFDVEHLPQITSTNQDVAASLSIDWPYFTFDVPKMGTEVQLMVNGREYVFPIIDERIEKPSILLAPGTVVPNTGLVLSEKFRTVGTTPIGTVSGWVQLQVGETILPIASENQSIIVIGRPGETGLLEIYDGDDVIAFPRSLSMLTLRPKHDGTYKIMMSGADDARYVLLNNTLEHTATDWEIATDEAMTDVTYRLDGSVDNLSRLPIALDAGNYYIRCRYYAGMASSDWSVPVFFKVEEDTSGKTEKSIIVDFGYTMQENFGAAVSIGKSGLLAIGAPTDHKSENASGAVYVYQTDGYLSQRIERLGSVTRIYQEDFGAAVTVRDDNRIFIGAPGYAGGKIYCYDYVDGGFSLAEEILCRPTSVRFGSAIKVIDDYLFVGDPLDSVNGEGTGAVHIYAHSQGSYQYQGAIYPQTPVNGGHFGCSIESDNSGNLLFIGATSPDPEVTENGMFYIFRKIAGSYAESEIRNSPMPSAGDGFGRALAYDALNSKLYVGCEHDSAMGASAGAVFVFSLEVATSLVLTLVDTIYPTNPNDMTRFGSALSSSSDGYRLYVGLPGHEINGIDAGAVRCLT